MKVVGIVVEYNPFHNGHLYHLSSTIQLSDADCVIAVMSGQFLQRGEPAIVSKWQRTRMALLAGLDLVIELPYAYATQKAETFANGAIGILQALQCDEIYFGSEDGEIEAFHDAVKILNDEESTYNEYIKAYAKEGKSYPKSTNLALQHISQDINLDLTLPNNILGFHYVKAINDQGANIQPKTIKRFKAGYHDDTFHDTSIASATSIRQALANNDFNVQTVEAYVPTYVTPLLHQYTKLYTTLHNWEHYYKFLKYRLAATTSEELTKIYEIEEGLENRILKLIPNKTSYYDFMVALKTKRYTWTRLQRALTHILTNTTKESMHKATECFKPSYIRLLGMSLIGQSYLQQIKQHLDIPIVSNTAAFKDNSVFTLDIKATQVYASILPEPERTKLAKQEFTQPPIRYNQQKKEFI
ncbi:nucleotidyltransferase [Bacillus sp. HMF5848]|uniref:nucleotidyltransferase n=1 Tax=Bacillus sp. HMF5848 TaxID=2495421 RepID=UPI000F76A9D4|nr:nucleotidyltransferase [Bacillus sp. HMF5848]RSK26923.1 nucleotidyltransferase [Bacillus sp. HMF5848]